MLPFEFIYSCLNILELVKILNRVLGLIGFGVLSPYVVWDIMATEMDFFTASDEASLSMLAPFLPSQELRQLRQLWTNCSHKRYENIVKAT